MFRQSTEERLSSWFSFRKKLENSQSPLQDVCDFWKNCPFIPYNKNIDPFNQYSWPSPWEIIQTNKYDDFTKALMIAWTLKLTDKFKNSNIEIRTIVDNTKTGRYNIIILDNEWILNFDDNGPINDLKILDSFLIENLIEVQIPR